MKLKSVTIENVKSFRDKTTIELDKSFNILIGPNAGDKSNLLDIITGTVKINIPSSYRKPLCSLLNEKNSSTAFLSPNVLCLYFNPLVKPADTRITLPFCDGKPAEIKTQSSERWL